MAIAGKNLKYLRKLRGWTQEEFSNKLGIKRSLLGAYEVWQMGRVAWSPVGPPTSLLCPFWAKAPEVVPIMDIITRAMK